MKFGSQLKDAIYPEWREYYIDYDGLKRKLRKAEKDRPFTEKDETEFVEVLDSNLEKIYAFHQQKLEEITSRIDSWDQVIASQPEPSEMTRVQENINEIADDVNRLARFSRLNYTGFLKIVKKHDRHTNYILRPMFMVRLNQCPFWKQDDDALLIKLSELFSKARQGGKEMSFKKPLTVKSQESSSTVAAATAAAIDRRRNTVMKRFFVHTDNILELKTFVLRHLPVLVYRDNSLKQDNIDPPISSLYLDNAALDTYNSRIESAEGSQVIRLRWYGSAKNNTTIAVERRTLADEEHRELTDRFVIKDKYVDGFLRGEQTFIEKSVAKMRNKMGKSEQDVARFEQLAKDVQRMVMENHMHPVLRTYYRRTAFQIPGDTRVRMALDTDLCFIREDSGLFADDKTVRRPEGQWHRTDADIEYPFPKLASSEVNRYPYATFEIKLDLPPGTPEPEWIVDLEESGILEEAHHFSKFVHGIALIFDARVALLPYWLAQIDEDVVDQLPVLPSQTPSVTNKSSKGKDKASPPLTLVAGDEQEDERYTLPQRSSITTTPPSAAATERTLLLGHRGSSGITRSYMGINNAPADGASTSAAAVAAQDEASEPVAQKFGQMWKQWIGKDDNSEPSREPVVLPPGVRVPKKVVTPLRVEPKVFFANERTYFSWMSLGTLLSTFSLALFNAGDAVGKVSGVIYTLVSLSTLIYGVGLYYRRRELIRSRSPGPYDEIAGPTVICFALMFAVGLNAYLKFTVHSPSLFYFY
ncbi:VTC domain-containing protein [Zychaea mexicana]|uniref:VTC domain-containing protein n=1 Tax=Zychaea mexicana TaxID=64656 RepID=UPI0022FE3EB0|nr:VTC domain-containing protein [Zychaea mexicana]KAI9496419.1 VTC domain-containing protein [Zychaea mexicana]